MGLGGNVSVFLQINRKPWPGLLCVQKGNFHFLDVGNQIGQPCQCHITSLLQVVLSLKYLPSGLISDCRIYGIFTLISKRMDELSRLHSFKRLYLIDHNLVKNVPLFYLFIYFWQRCDNLVHDRQLEPRTALLSMCLIN